jgi:hypothetical protein
MHLENTLCNSSMIHNANAIPSLKYFFLLLVIGGLVVFSATKSTAQALGMPMTGHAPHRPMNITVNSINPNPFTVRTTLQYTLKKEGHVVIKVSDIKGRELQTLFDGKASAGKNELEISAKMFDASGIYYCALTWESEPPITCNLSFQK